MTASRSKATRHETGTWLLCIALLELACATKQGKGAAIGAGGGAAVGAGFGALAGGSKGPSSASDRRRRRCGGGALIGRGMDKQEAD